MLKAIMIALAICGLASNAAAQERMQTKNLVRSSQIIGMQVRDGAGQNVGDVKDVVLDRDQGTIAYAIVAYDASIPNAQDKLFAVPWSSMKPAPSDKSAFALENVAKDRLQSAPGFDKNEFPDLADAKTTSDIRAFYGERDMTRDGETAREQDMNRNRDMNMDHDRNMNASGEVVSANRESQDAARPISSYSGTVRSLNRGDPSELVVTTDRGELGAELAPSTWLDQQQIRLDPDTYVTVKGYETTRSGRRTFVTTEILANGRTMRLRGYDNAPLWSDNTNTTATTNGTTTTTTTGTSFRDVTGTVTYVETGRCSESAQGREVTIRMADGDRVVALGPGTYLDSHNLYLRPNDTVTVRGYDADHRGRRVFIATEVRRGGETLKLRNDDGTPLWR